MSGARGVFTYSAIAPTWRSRRQPGSREIHAGLRLNGTAAPGAKIGRGRGRGAGAGLPKAVICHTACTWARPVPLGFGLLVVVV
jgi:hypothetical protein